VPHRLGKLISTSPVCAVRVPCALRLGTNPEVLQKRQQIGVGPGREAMAIKTPQ
jgi:hypothetical protein